MTKQKRKRIIAWSAVMAAVAIAWWGVTTAPPPQLDNFYGMTEEATESVVNGGSSSQKASLPSRTLDGKLIVRYYDSGFAPFTTEVKRGETVQFINQSNAPLWVTTDGHPTAKQQLLSELNFGRSINAGETYDFVANKPGSWGFYNLNNNSHLGALVITE